MAAPSNSLTLHPLSATALTQLIEPGRAVDYLSSYLSALLLDESGAAGAGSIAYEGHYVDRHYLDDFAAYYARSFATPSSSCSRLHFFRLSDVALNDAIDTAYAGGDAAADALKILNDAYLGFVVKRPLPGAAIGRTVLRTYPVEGRRVYGVVRPYHVHLGGLKLRIEGLAYQQQDGGAAVCASTALWSALQKTADVAGHRTPTPSSVTAAAQSPFPANTGLTSQQMAQALNNLGYIADAFSPQDNRDLFRAKLVGCLRSQLPVVLCITRRHRTSCGEVTIGHAVTITGFSEPNGVVQVPAPGAPTTPPLPMRTGVDVVYVHDDNIGSHAHYELFDTDDLNEEGHKKLMLLRGRRHGATVPGWIADEWAVSLALVPKPNKLRAPIDTLYLDLLALRPLVQACLPGADVHYSVHFTTGVSYKQRVVAMPVRRDLVRDFLERTALPRHVGVVSVHRDALHVCDFVIDVSEFDRMHSLALGAVLAVVGPGVPSGSFAGMALGVQAGRFGWSSLFAP